ncbi:hypothetical protein MARPO_0008s0011 [Marchantia polymorpha]|uniref:V-type proton ATPase subunit n=1 Tax=Marchantia polymorpha TaxID=3197 RepID=A0A2R6XM71_MARPO|nr:hypothetical protein MARPO_0008s0011 [Marchantia polymorpha]|eukprot:PTQ47217.1 hypothetical protein MARPO_0008s0011 [Marchantia polymorpha]
MASGFFLTTLYFIFASLVGTFGIKWLYDKAPSFTKLLILLVNTAIICCYLIWVIVWMAQWNPLVVPILKNPNE